MLGGPMFRPTKFLGTFESANRVMSRSSKCSKSLRSVRDCMCIVAVSEIPRAPRRDRRSALVAWSSLPQRSLEMFPALPKQFCIQYQVSDSAGISSELKDPFKLRAETMAKRHWSAISLSKILCTNASMNTPETGGCPLSRRSPLLVYLGFGSCEDLSQSFLEALERRGSLFVRVLGRTSTGVGIIAHGHAFPVSAS